MHHSNFAELADQNTLKSVMESPQNVIKIDIQTLLEQMTPDSYLEIKVPTTSLTDFLAAESALGNTPQAFASPLAINGFGAKNTPSTHNDLGQSEHVLATDILGNNFEILVNEHGQVEVPQDGTGLFSMLSHLTFLPTSKRFVFSTFSTSKTV